MRSFTTTRTITLFSLTFLTLSLAFLHAQAKTDFSGTWKLNAAKSDFGPMPPPDSMTEKITHQEPSLKANVSTTGGMQGDMSYDVNYTTDGKECVNHVADNEFKSTLHWDGADLVVETKGSFSGNEFTSKDRWTLSADGKTLSVARHLSSAMGEADMKTVFDKQ
jgi:hypothetical protein